MAYASTKAQVGSQNMFVSWTFTASQATSTPTIGSIVQTLGSAGFTSITVPSTLVYHLKDASVAVSLSGGTNGVDFLWDVNVDQQNQNVNGNTAQEVSSNTSRINPFIDVPVTLLPTQQVYFYAYPAATVATTAPTAALETLIIRLTVEPYSSFKARMRGGK